MVYFNTIGSIFELEATDNANINLLYNFIKLGIKLVQNTTELKEELLNYDNIYQVQISDLDFNFWVKISKGSLTYSRGINFNATLDFTFTRQLLVKLIKEEITFSEAYLKGLLKMHGNLSQAIKIRNLINYFIRYLKKTYYLDD